MGVLWMKEVREKAKTGLSIILMLATGIISKSLVAAKKRCRKTVAPRPPKSIKRHFRDKQLVMDPDGAHVHIHHEEFHDDIIYQDIADPEKIPNVVGSHFKGKLVYSRADVAKHCTRDDLWVVIDDAVFNATSWVDFHPGGTLNLLERAGADVTYDFWFHDHSHHAWEILRNLHIGYVAEPARFLNHPPITFRYGLETYD